MKKLVLASLLLTVPVLAADSTPVQKRTVREFVINNGVEDWWLDGGWSWSEGTLTHWSGSGQGTATLRSMPPLIVGHTYGIDFKHSGSSTGTVRISLGKDASPDYTWPGTFPMALMVKDADALLTLTPTNDYDGSISEIRIVELGDELVGENTWTLSEGWSREGNAFSHVSGVTGSLVSSVPVVAGHTYRVYFGVSDVPNAGPTRKGGTVSFGGQQARWFTNANFSFDLLATNDSPLVIDPADDGASFPGKIDRVSVREMISDPVPAPAPTNP